MHFIFSISNTFLLFVRDFCFLLCTHKKHSPWHFDFHFLKQNSFPWLWIEWSSVMFFGRLNRYPGILLCLNLVLIIPVRIILQVCLVRLLEVLGLHFTYFPLLASVIPILPKTFYIHYEYLSWEKPLKMNKILPLSCLTFI